MKKITFLALLAIFMMSCSGDDTPDETTNPENNVVLLKHYSIESIDGLYNYDIEYEGTRMINLKSDNNTLVQDYIYTNNVLTNIKTPNGNNVGYELIIEYNQNGKISKNTIIQQGEEKWRNELSYPSENIFVETSYINGFPDATANTYTTLNGNIIKTENASRRIEYEYDNKNAPKKNIEFANVFQLIRFDNGGEYGNNNRTKQTTYIQDEIYEVYTYEYTYDANNYPLTKECFHNGIYINTITYSYE